MVPDLERVIRVHAAVQPRRRAQDRLFGDVAVAADVDGDGRRRRRLLGGRRRGAVEIAPDHGFALDHGFAAQDDALGSVDLGPPRDFVARVLVWLVVSWA